MKKIAIIYSYNTQKTANVAKELIKTFDTGRIEELRGIDSVPGAGAAAVFIANVTIAPAQVAQALINDQVVATATRQNGGVVDRSGQALATLSVLLPAGSATVEVDWTATNGEVSREVVHYP